jgi:hypothetical protein
MEDGATANNRLHLGHSAKGKKNNKLRNITIAAAGLLVAIIAFVSWSFYQSSVTAHIDSAKYQAVFLTNGQVYFGKLQRLNGDYYRLNDIFYLQTKSAESSTNPQETSSDKDSEVQLIKLGNEIHGPDDEMIMTKEQILFIENLKKDSTVTKTILDYKKK